MSSSTGVFQDISGIDAGDEIDFAQRRAPAPRQDAVTLEPQKPGRRRLGPEATAVGPPSLVAVARCSLSHRVPG